MSLTEAIKDVIAGTDVAIIGTNRFVNALDDFHAFSDEPPASKKVMKGLMDAGFGKLILEYSCKKNDCRQSVIRGAINAYAATSGYKDELVKHVALAILNGVGLIGWKPTAEKQIATRKSSQSADLRIEGPRGLMFILKQEYVEALRELITIASDEYGLNLGFFTTEANTELYVVESKLRLIARELNDQDINQWISAEKKKIEEQHRPSPSEIDIALNKILSSLEEEYRATMADACVIATDELGLKTAHFNPANLSILLDIENKILVIGRRKNIDLQSWIDKTKSDFLASKSSSAATIKEILEAQKQEYESSLEKFCVIDTDEFGLKFARFNPKNKSDLIEVEKKILTLGKRNNQDLQPWIDKTKEDFLSLQSSSAADINRVIDEQKNEYLARISALDAATNPTLTPKFFFGVF